MKADNSGQEPYQLLDSGDELKLERFGQKLIARPSSLAIWKRRSKAWQEADATFEPTHGWKFKAEKFETWQARFGSIDLELRLQQNGQVGVFPDHWLYAHALLNHLKGLSGRRSNSLKVLNLFAYTGLASLLCAKAGAEVCHVDLSKTAVSWCQRNLELNTLKGVRLICDDALKFTAREVKRSAKYDVVISDPPSFGRLSKTKSWKLEEIIHSHLLDCFTILNNSGLLLFSSHHAALEAQVLANIISDLAPHNAVLQAQPIFIPEQTGIRKMPAGHLVICKLQ